MKDKQLKKIYSGAILLEALLVMGILMMSMPIIVQQIQRRNETVENLVISEEIKSVQNAASGFVLFEKEDLFKTYFPEDRCDTQELSYSTILPHLQQYGFPTSFYSNSQFNPLGLRHSLILHCKIDSSSNRVLTGYAVSRISSSDELSSIKINEVLNMLGWNAAFIEHDDNVGTFVVSNLPDYRLPAEVKNMIGINAFVISLESQQNFGDYLAKTFVNNNPMHNTMMTELDMNSNNIYCISDISGYEMKILDPNGWQIKYLKTKDLTAKTLNGENLKYHSYNREYSNSLVIETPALYATDITAHTMSVRNFDTHGVVNVKGHLNTSKLQVDSSATIGELGFPESIDVDVLKLVNSNNQSKLLPIIADNYKVMNAIIVTGSDDIVDNIENPRARISVGDKSTMVKDIKINDKFLSDIIVKQVESIKAVLNEATTTWW